jgi:hypothetical protein
MAACFDDLSAFMTHDFYRKNFQLFGHNPANDDGAPMA